MASDIVITPSRGSTTVNAKIDFTGASTASSQIRLEVLPDNSLSFVGTAGSLFSIADSVTGSLMSVNDASGLPILEVFDTDKVVMGQYNQNTLVVNGTQVGIGTGSPTNKLTIAGVNNNGITLTGANGTITSAGATPNLILSAGTNIYLRPTSGYNVIIDSGNGLQATSGTITGTRLISNIATGTAPLTVTSTTLVTNLNADLVDGLHVHTGTNNVANQIVRTDANGYIQAGWINTISGDNGTTAIDRVYASSDAYIRTYTPTNFRTVLNVPTRTGGDASGTWGISISGNAATATSADQIDGVAFRNTSNAGTAADSLNQNGITWVNTNISLLGQTDGALYSQAYDANWQHQIYGDYRTGQIVVRGKQNATWQAWRTVLDSSNYTTYVGNGTLTLSVSGTGLSGSASFTANQSGNTTFTVTSNATSANTASTLVARDVNGDFQARNITTQQNYTNGWYRNNTNNSGLYNETTFLHLSSTGANTSYLDISTVGSSQSGIRFYTGGHVNTLRGYIVANTSNELMLWNSGGSYSARFTSSVSEIYQDTYVPNLYANLMYDRNDTGYYNNPASTSVFNRLEVAGYPVRSSATIDMSNTATYATTNFYPVTIPLVYGMPTRMRIVNALNSNVPSWSTHAGGFTCHVEWTSNGSGWGTIAVQRSIHRYTEGYTTSVICGGITQMTNSSIEVIWLRGGGRYYFEADAQVTPTAQSTTYTLNSQSVTPSSSAQNDVLSAAVDTRPSFQRLNLTQSTGTAPMTVSSTTLVTNLNADLLDGYNSAETGSSIILRTQSNGYLNIDNWIQVGSAGLYSSVNSAHWTPNQTGSYSPWRIINSRGGYGGIYDDYSGVNWMHDSSGNGGLFRPANSRWFIYGHIANGCVGIGGSSTTSGYAMQVNGNSYVSGYARLAGNLYIDYNYGLGVVGLYSATRYQGIFAMGDSYKLPADGTTTGSLYGIAWSHPNAGGVAANLNTHGMLVMENGTFLAAVSGSIRCRDDMRAPLFYDSNDTAYFIDPSSGQSDNQGGKIKWNFTVNGEGATTGRGLGLYPSYTSNVPTYGITFAQTANLGTHGNVTGDWVTYFTMNNSANRGWIFRDVGTPANVASISNAGRMRIASLGVNTDASATNGEIRATDNITAYYSDERLKTKLGAIQNPIEKVKSLSGFYFEANETAVALGYQKKREVGVSAQEVQAILPEIIAPAPIDEQYMTVRYEKLIPLLIEAIKEQQKQIEELKSLLNK